MSLPTDRSPLPGQVKVMISSTSLDLPEHRKAVMDAILRAGCMPLAMEHGTATSDSGAIRFSLALVDQADVYVGVFGFRYGDVQADSRENPQGWSDTEHEYRRAIERKIPVLAYLMSEDHPIKRKDVDQEPVKVAKLAALKDELLRGICAFFSSPAELHSLVIQSLNEEKLKLGRDASPPQRDHAASIPHPPELYAVPPYTLSSAFVGRTAELERLDAWAVATDPVMVVEAIGGMGKSALTWEWVQQRAEAAIPGLAGRVWWSFYERGTSMRTFLRHTLAYVTRQNAEALRDLDAYESGQLLLAELRRLPYLLVLDGFERVLTAYHRLNKAQLRDDQVPSDDRECTNPKDGDILRQLVHCGQSRLLVSTRLMPRALQDRHTHQPIPGVRHLQLEGLAPKDALDVVRSAGIGGDGAAILQFAEQFDFHALVLRIVCGMVADYRPRPGDFDAWHTDPFAGGGLRLSELPLKQRYTHILEFAFRGLGEKTRQLLSRIAVLSDSADYATIAVLNPFLPAVPEAVAKPVELAENFKWKTQTLERRLRAARSSRQRDSIEEEKAPYRSQHAERAQAHDQYQKVASSYLASAEYQRALTDFHAALSDLEERSLLEWNREANTYDLHPVIRAYAYDQLKERDRIRAYNAVGDHFAALPPENVKDATELAHVRNSLEILRALMGAGRFEEAFQLYKGEFSDSLEYSIGANHMVAELLRPLVRSPKGSPILADALNQSCAMTSLANALSRMGHYEDAAALHRDAIQLDLNRLERWPEYLVIDLQNLGETIIDLNLVASAHGMSELAHELAAVLDDEDIRAIATLDRMNTACLIGRFEEAESLLASFQQCNQPPREIYRPGGAEYALAALWFFQGRLTSVSLDDAEEVASSARSIHWLQFLASLRGEWELTRGNTGVALDAIERALSIARRTGLPFAALLGMRALALARLGQISEARDALVEADDAQGERSLRYPLFAAETWLTLGDRERACAFIRLAYRFAWADGPPFVRWYDLKQCRELLVKLGAPEPELPAFDPAKVEPIPFEAEIRSFIDELKAKQARAHEAATEEPSAISDPKPS